MTHIAQKGPYKKSVVEGKRYIICACGLSQRQPMCDGAHINAPGIAPVMYKAETSGDVFFCGCKQSKTFPLCDGTHNSL
jgi:CDGSH-type Zn-finger protein